MPTKINSFELRPGRKPGHGYVVQSLMSKGTEGEDFETLEDSQRGIKV